MAKILDGWEYWCDGGADSGLAWGFAMELKRLREMTHPGLFVRVKVVKRAGVHWILRSEEPRQETAA